MNNLKKYREKRQISQTRLAELLGLSDRSYLSQCETGRSRLSLKMAQKISKVLSVDLYGLMGDEFLQKEIRDDKKKKSTCLAIAYLSHFSNVEEAIEELRKKQVRKSMSEKIWKRADIPKKMTTPRTIERRKEEIRMLQVNKKTFDEAQKVTGLTMVAFAEKLGLKVRSYRSKKSDKSKNFTLKHILRAQELSGIPITNFFTEKCHQNGHIK